ncbi:MAG: hypothetical protein GC129_05590 [Proteobacteria bacterium]|nr:hypothetical protein [Pseudomonadota bacterium]
MSFIQEFKTFAMRGNVIELADGQGALIPQILQLVGVPGIHAVVVEKLGHSFQLYNCCGVKPKERTSDTELRQTVSFHTQLLNQASSELMDC